MVNVDQLLASEEQFVLAEAQAMERACADAFAGRQVRAWAWRGGGRGLMVRLARRVASLMAGAVGLGGRGLRGLRMAAAAAAGRRQALLLNRLTWHRWWQR